jgi:hypothetical protein|tara:strand:- start:1190 stop:1498 length:309 start_codon:yes stop_codon:yes gene_type:complete
MKFNFNAIANAISIASGVTLAGIIGVGSYIYVNKDAIIDDIKKDAIESIGGAALGGLAGGGALGGIGGALTGDVGKAPQQAAPSQPSPTSPSLVPFGPPKPF